MLWSEQEGQRADEKLHMPCGENSRAHAQKEINDSIQFDSATRQEIHVKMPQVEKNWYGLLIHRERSSQMKKPGEKKCRGIKKPKYILK